ncbi:MAG TPA: hypothetical protein VFO34_09265 [Candidatus Acidoferrales bacterium]|nr:hypothetical protein [Candidatus Acidoferrales bacterium]
MTKTLSAFLICVAAVLSGCFGGGHGGGGGNGGGGGTPQTGLGFSPSSTTTFAITGGSSGQVTLIVDNLGNLASSGATTVTFSLLFNNGTSTGVTFVANGSGGTGWDCSASTATNVSCTTNSSVAAGGTAATLTIVLNAAANAVSFATQPLVSNAGNSNNGQQTYTLSINVTPPPNITVTKRHVGSAFVAGTQAQYTIAVTNAGAGPGNGVKVTDMLPAGLTFASFTSGTAGAGTGGAWSCTAAGQVVTCTLAAALNSGVAATSLTLTVTVATTAPSSISNTASVTATLDTGTTGKSSTDTVTVTPPAPVLAIKKQHTGNFTQAQTGAIYTLTVSNTGSVATSGAVTVTEAPPGSLTVTGMAGGTGSLWSCTVATLTCTRSDALAAGASYDAITVTVNVQNTAPASITNQANVSGGGAANASASDPTTVNPNNTIPNCPLPTLGKESLLNGMFAGQANGWNDLSNGLQGPFQLAGAWRADGAGNIGLVHATFGSVMVGTGSVQKAPIPQQFFGCYNLGNDLRGMMIWQPPAGNEIILSIAVKADGSGGRFMQFDDLNPSTNPGTRDAGYFEKQVQVTSTNAPVAFAFTGYNPNGAGDDYRRSAGVGIINTIVFGSGTASAGTVNVAATNGGTGTQANIDSVAFTAVFGVPDALGGGLAVFNFPNFPGICATAPCPLTLNYAYYMGATGRIFFQSNDAPDNNGHSLNNGEAIPQSGGPFSNSSVTKAVFQMTGADLSSTHAFTDTAVGLIVNQSGAVTFDMDEIRQAGVEATGTHGIPNGSLSIGANGMGTITVGNSTAFGGISAPFSVAMYAPNAGFIVEGTQALAPSPGTVLVGDFGPQTAPAGGFVDGTFAGTYIFGTDHPASISSPQLVGSLSTPGVQTSPASFSGKLDGSTGNGCATNCLVPGQSGMGTYTIDANGRMVITFTSPTTDTAIGWLLDSKNVVLISNVNSLVATILKAIQ